MASVKPLSAAKKKVPAEMLQAATHTLSQHRPIALLRIGLLHYSDYVPFLPAAAAGPFASVGALPSGETLPPSFAGLTSPAAGLLAAGPLAAGPLAAGLLHLHTQTLGKPREGAGLECP